MGVLGLWQLLAPVGQPVTLESLENKIFAVDISIWLNQAVKGYRDSTGGSVPNAHLLSLFSRLCKLLFYRIRPIIVFDGGFPELKKQTIINRQQRRAAVKQSSREVGLKLLTNYVASQQLDPTSSTSSTNKVTFKNKEKPRDELFKLPPLPDSSKKILSDSQEESEDIERKFTDFSKQDIKYLNQIDIESDDFDNLPPSVKNEILSTLKESRRHRTWDQYEELPKESNDFSNYQMQFLLKKRKLQSKLEQVQKDLRKINSSAYVSQYTNDHVIGETNKIMSDDTSYYVLLKKITDKKASDSDKNLSDEKTVMADTKSAFIKDIENIDYYGDEEDDLKVAILNSLSDLAKEKKHSLDLSDEEYDIDNPPSQNSEKQQHIQSNNKVIESIAVKHNVFDSTVDQSSFDFKASQQGSSITKVEVNDGIIYEDSTNDKNIPDIEILKVKDIDQKKILKSVIALSDDELIPCKEENPCNLVKNIEENINQKAISDHSSIVSSDEELIPCGDESTSNLLENIEGKHINQIRGDACNILPTINSENISSTGQIKQHGNSKTFLVPAENLLNDGILSNVASKSTFHSVLPSTSALHSDLPSTLHSDLPSTSTSNPDVLRQGTELSKPHKILSKNLQDANLDLQRELETAAAILEKEQAKQDRQASTVQDHMIEECKELLQLFGIPYIVSPLEAEAQCAYYDKVDLTHGTITDDSDVWLFGGKRVYKNFFSQQKFVECYKDKEIFSHFGLSRMKLINFALLTGSDYTEGIEGVGPVTAMEIISEFPGVGIDSLQNFRQWWEDANKHTRTPENKVRAKLRKFLLYNNFPDEKIFDAYLNPEVDSSTEKFTWGRPDLDAIREYAKERFAWNQSKVDDALLPVLKKLNERNSQTHIDSFFTVTLKKEKNLFPSKRIMSALKKITSPQKVDSGDKVENKPTKRKARTSKKVNKKAAPVRGRKVNVKSQGPALSESSSDSDC